MAKMIGPLVTFLCFCNLVFGQTTVPANTHLSKTTHAKEEFQLADKYPSYPGGIKAFHKYISNNLEYPEDAEAQGIEGKVFVSFVIDANGHIQEDKIKIIKSLSKSCDREAVRLIANRPEWIPGYSETLKKEVPTNMVLPITFDL